MRINGGFGNCKKKISWFFCKTKQSKQTMEFHGEDSPNLKQFFIFVCEETISEKCKLNKYFDVIGKNCQTWKKHFLK